MMQSMRLPHRLLKKIEITLYTSRLRFLGIFCNKEGNDNLQITKIEVLGGLRKLLKKY